MKLHYFSKLLVVLALLTSCDNNSEISASIVGTWKGDRAKLNIQPEGFPFSVPYDLDDFNAILIFKSDGSLTVSDDTQSYTGTYKLEDDQLTIHSDFMIEDIDMSGTYHVMKLNKTVLEIEIDKTETVKNPSTGADISGTVKAELYFTR